MTASTFPHPLRLAVGSHQRGSGRGCAMNVVSYENGDATITDLPDCADRLLARVVQNVNDRICTHREGDLLCPPCSLDVLALAHRTVGTNLTAFGWNGDRQWRLWVRLAIEEAISVEHLSPDERVRTCNATVLRWLSGNATIKEVREARSAAYAASAAAYAAAYADAAAYAASAAYASAADAAYAASAAAYAAAYADAAAASAAAAAASADTPSRLARAHALIDRFEQHTGIHAASVPATVTAQAVAAIAVK